MRHRHLKIQSRLHHKRDEFHGLRQFRVGYFQRNNPFDDHAADRQTDQNARQHRLPCPGVEKDKSHFWRNDD